MEESNMRVALRNARSIWIDRPWPKAAPRRLRFPDPRDLCFYPTAIIRWNVGCAYNWALRHWLDFSLFFVRKTINSFIITVGVCRSNGIDKERELRYFFAPMLGRNSFIITDFFHLRFVEFTKQQWMNQKIKMVPVISAFIFLSCCRK